MKAITVNTKPKNWRPTKKAAEAVAKFINKKQDSTGNAPSINEAVNELIVKGQQSLEVTE